MLILDAGGVSRLAVRDRATAALLIALRRRGLWPPAVPTVVLVECLTGSPGRDANTNRLLKICDMRAATPERLARRAAEPGTKAGRGAAVDAVVVAAAEPGDTVLTSDGKDTSPPSRPTRSTSPSKSSDVAEDGPAGL